MSVAKNNLLKVKEDGETSDDDDDDDVISSASNRSCLTEKSIGVASLYNCNHCGLKFKYKIAIKRHIENNHQNAFCKGNESPNKPLTFKGNLGSSSKMQENQTRWTCQICNKKFVSEQNYSEHSSECFSFIKDKRLKQIKRLKDFIYD